MTERAYKSGQLIRIKKTGRIARIEDVNPNENYLADDELWGMATGGMGTVDIGSPDEIEPHTATLPEEKEIAKDISSALHTGFGDGLRVEETEVDGSSIYVYGESNGVPVSLTLRVMDFETRI